MDTHDAAELPALHQRSWQNWALLAGLSVMVLGLVAHLTHQQVVCYRHIESARKTLAQESGQRERAERRLDVVKDSLDNVSHEFRTPLTIIKEHAAATADLLQDEHQPEIQRFLDIIVTCADDLTLMVNDILDSSLLERNIMRMSRRACRIEEIVAHIERVLSRKAEKCGVTFDVVVEEGLPDVYCDAQKIGRVIVNLVVNAIKFSGEGGRVQLQARVDAAHSSVHISVTDDGPGIPVALQEAVFQRFQQVPNHAGHSTHGFGLGLSIARELVDLNLGELRVESESGVGTVFSFAVPTAEPAALVNHYVARVSDLRDAVDSISLISVTGSATMAPTAWAACERFLEMHARRTDLLVSHAPRGWTLVAAADRAGAWKAIERLERAFLDTTRTRMSDDRTPLHFDLVGTWRLTERAELTHAFVNACDNAKASWSAG